MKKSNVYRAMPVIMVLFLLAFSSCNNLFSPPAVSKFGSVDSVATEIIPGTGDLPFEDIALESDVSEPAFSETPRIPSPTPAKVIILMYHNVINNGVPGEYDRTVTDLRNDMTFLKNQGIAVIDFDDLLAIQAGTMTSPAERLAMIAFDDGYASVYTYAFPILKEYGYKATFFLISSFVSNAEASADPDWKPFLTWKQVKTMSAYRQPGTGSRLFKMGSHTVDHPFLQNRVTSFSTRNQYLQWLNKELNQSKAAIERNVGAANNGAMVLALPYGNGYGNADIINTAKRFGYKGIRTSEWGSFTPLEIDNFKLKSLPILGNSDIAYMNEVYMW